MTAPTRERPILFSAPMVRAILAGTKTQTRRIVKPQPYVANVIDGVTYWNVSGSICGRIMFDADFRAHCPYGVLGDRLWVREACRAHELTDKEAEEDAFGVMERKGLECPLYGLDGVIYKADGVFREIENTREASELWMELNAYRGKRGVTVPPIHMPRWASRITLEVTDVRVERLQEISPEDAIAEGAMLDDNGRRKIYGYTMPVDEYWRRSPVDAYMHLWERIHGAGSWDTNPWVWVVCFRRLP